MLILLVDSDLVIRAVLTGLLGVCDIRACLAVDLDAVSRSCYEYAILQLLFCSRCDRYRILGGILFVAVRCRGLLESQFLLAICCRQIVLEICIISLDREAAACVCGYLCSAVIQLEGCSVERLLILILLVDLDLSINAVSISLLGVGDVCTGLAVDLDVI